MVRFSKVLPYKYISLRSKSRACSDAPLIQTEDQYGQVLLNCSKRFKGRAAHSATALDDKSILIFGGWCQKEGDIPCFDDAWLFDALRRRGTEVAKVRMLWFGRRGEEPPGIAALRGEADTAVWVGDWTLPPTQQGLSVLGTPFGSDAYVQQRLALKREEHERLLQRIPSVQDLQAAWLLLHYCAAPCPNYLLRSLPPATTAAYVPRMTQP
eukprot:s351_g22.t1